MSLLGSSWTGCSQLAESFTISSARIPFISLLWRATSQSSPMCWYSLQTMQNSVKRWQSVWLKTQLKESSKNLGFVTPPKQTNTATTNHTSQWSQWPCRHDALQFEFSCSMLNVPGCYEQLWCCAACLTTADRVDDRADDCVMTELRDDWVDSRCRYWWRAHDHVGDCDDALKNQFELMNSTQKANLNTIWIRQLPPTWVMVCGVWNTPVSKFLCWSRKTTPFRGPPNVGTK